MKKDDYKIAIIILNYNTPKETIKCVESIKKVTMENVVIIVVDNGSKDESLSILKECFEYEKQVILLETGKNLGFSGGMNFGLQYAQKLDCDAFCLTNSDILFEEDFFVEIRSIFSKNRDIGIIGPSLYNLDGQNSQHAQKNISVGNYLFSISFLPRIFRKTAYKMRFYEYDSSADYIFSGMVSGACFAIRKELLENDGKLLDDKIFLYYEEDVVASIAQKKNYKSMIKAETKVIHCEGASTKKTINHLSTIYFHASPIYVLNKYCGCSEKRTRTLIWLVRTRLRLREMFNSKSREIIHSFDEELNRLFN